MLKSFIDVSPESDFPIKNLPYGVFRKKNDEIPRIGTAIGDFVLDLHQLEKNGFLKKSSLPDTEVFLSPVLNPFMAKGKAYRVEVRNYLQKLLSEDNPVLRDNAELRNECLIPAEDISLLMPVDIGDYTDFYSSREHATNVGIMFRGKDNALMPNWLHLPVGYHGRSSSIVISGTDVYRPKGQTKDDNKPMPDFGPSQQLDFELEMGFFVSNGNDLGEPIKADEAEDHIFGMVIINDWSARDIQKWEYVPLGPFLAKNFATSISPWIVTMEALEPFKIAGPVQEPEPLEYLKTKSNVTYDIILDVFIENKKLKHPFLISKSNFKYLYWNICQQLAHHTITGCNMRTGDLLGSGTISGPEPENFGSMLELSWKGTKPVKLPSGDERKFINDGDNVIMKGYCEGKGYRIGFGAVSGRILHSK